MSISWKGPHIGHAADGDRLLATIARRDWAWLAALGCGSLALAGGALLLPAAVGHAVDAAIARSGDGIWLASCALLVAMYAGAETLTELAIGVSGATATARLRELLAAHALAVGPGLGLSAGDATSRVTGSAADAGTGPPSTVAAVAAVILPVGSVVALWLTDPWLATAFAVAFPLLVVVLRGLARDSSTVAADYGRVQGAITARLLDALAGARTIGAAGTQAAERRRILTPLAELRDHGYDTWRVQGRAAAQNQIIAPVLQVIVVAIAGVELARHHITPGGLAAASQYAVLATGIGASTAMVARLGVARGGARRVAGLLAVPAPRHGTTATISQGDGPGRARRNATVPHLLAPDGAVPDAPPGALTMRGIAVRRGGQDVLRDLDLTIPGGAVVALVGRSGAGKSTLAELAGRLADPTEGSVSLDGTDLRALTRGTLREAVVYAFERPHLFGATPREAIGFGPAVPPDEDIRAAASAAQAAQFIERLPLGYDTPLDEAPLSGGEVQRLGLARAFAHASTARVLVFDDATSSLDTITEMLVSRAMTERLRGRTRLIVAHRAATAARADLAAWLDEGRIRAIAPHDKLWRDPDYRSLWWGGPGGEPPPRGGPPPPPPPPGPPPPPPPPAPPPPTTAASPGGTTPGLHPGVRPTALPRGTPPDPHTPREARWRKLAGAGRMLIRQLRARQAELAWLAFWSLVQALPALASGWSIARATSRFLAGQVPAGLAWLGLYAAAAGAGALGVRQAYLRVGAIVEPLRDDLVAAVVAGALARSTTGAAALPDTRAVARLTHQAEIVRDSVAGLLTTSSSFVLTMAGALAGLVTLAPSTLPFVIIPLLITGILLRLLLRPTVIRQRAALLAGEEVAEATARAVSGVRDVTACGAEERVLADLADTIARQASAARSAARISAARVLCLAAGGWLPLLLVLAAAPSMLGHGASAGDIVGVITYITVSMRVALYTAGQAMGFGVVRLRVALDRIRQTAHAPQLTTDAPQLTADTPQLTADTPQLTPPFTDISEISGISWAGSPRETGNRTGNARGTANRTGNVKGTGSQTGNARGTANQTGNIKGTGSQARRFRESGRLASAGEIELRDVRFRYGPHAAPVIDGLSLRIPPGDHLAIAGPSGIGKSSLASLVAGTLRPCSGEVLLGGVAVTSCGRDWRVLIPQEAYVFTGTLRENLAYYRQEGDLPEKAELETAAEEVGLIPLLSRLGGYGADVSPAALSAGERQLIALTRAYLSPSPVAILDEATCHLDPAAEQRAEEAFARRGGTLIVIAHRITSARRARRILVLDGTRAQAGGHDELLAASPMYRDLAGHWASVPH